MSYYPLLPFSLKYLLPKISLFYLKSLSLWDEYIKNKNKNLLNNKIMKISHIEHLGIAVKSIEEALPYYENVLGLKCYNIETVEDQKVRTAFLKVGDVKIELLEPTSPESTIAKFIEKNNGNGGMHHLAFAVEDGVANALAEAEGTGIRLIDKAPRKGAEGLNIAFLHPKSTLGVLTELCENPNK